MRTEDGGTDEFDGGHERHGATGGRRAGDANTVQQRRHHPRLLRLQPHRQQNHRSGPVCRKGNDIRLVSMILQSPIMLMAKRIL